MTQYKFDENAEMELEPMNRRRNEDTDVERSKQKCQNCGFSLGNDIDISIPGLPRLVNPSYEKPAKLLWMIVITVCSIIGLYLTIHQLKIYFDAPVMTKVIVQRNNSITFPAFTVCSLMPILLLKATASDFTKQYCESQNMTNCNETFINITLEEAGIDLTFIWDLISLKEFTMTAASGAEFEPSIESENNNNSDFKFMKLNSILGDCINIRHVGEIPYLSAATFLQLKINSLIADSFVIIVHGEPDESLNSFEFLNNEFQIILPERSAQLSFHEERYILINRSESPCVDGIEQKKFLRECALNVLRKSYCRLPFLPDSFPECHSLNDIPKYGDNGSFSHLHELVRQCPPKPACEEVKYLLSIDYLYKQEDSESNEGLVSSTIIIRLSDDTVSIVSQEYSYTFPALVSDLFAYWGFFLCLSAFVFVEIFEFLFRKFLALFKCKAN